MKKKYKRAGTTSERQDYRKGGQVSKDGVREKLYPVVLAMVVSTMSQQILELMVVTLP